MINVNNKTIEELKVITKKVLPGLLKVPGIY